MLIFIIFALSCGNNYDSLYSTVSLKDSVSVSPLVVQGMISSVKQSTETVTTGCSRTEYGVNFAKLKISKTLKGKPKSDTVTVAFHVIKKDNLNKFHVRTSPYRAYKKGQEGIWVLQKDQTGDFYWASGRNDFRTVDKVKEVLKAIDFSEKEKKSQLYIALYPQPNIVLNKEYTLNLYMRNFSEKSFTIKPEDLKSFRIKNKKILSPLPASIKLIDLESARLSNKSASGKVSVVNVDMFQDSPSLTIPPNRRRIIAKVTLKPISLGPYYFIGYLEVTDENPHLKLWDGIIPSNENYGTVLDPDRHKLAKGIAKELFDLKEEDPTAYLSKIETIRTKGNVESIRLIQEGINKYPDRAMIMHDALESFCKQQKISALYECFDIVDTGYFNEVNLGLVRAAGLEKAEMTFPAGKRTYNYSAKGPKGSRNMSWDDEIAPEYKHIKTEKEFFKAWWKNVFKVLGVKISVKDKN